MAKADVKLHPVIWERVWIYSNAAINNPNQVQHQWTPQAAQGFQTWWWKRVGYLFIMLLLGVVVAMFGLVALLRTHFEDPAKVALLAGCFAILGLGVRSFQNRLRSTSAQGMSQLIPLFDGNATTQQYLRCVQNVSLSPAFDKGERESILKQLYELFDEHVRLEGKRESLQTAGADVRQREELAQEALRLRAAANDCQDAEAKATYMKSAEIAEERLRRLEMIGPISDRVQAQQELIRQTLGGFHDALANLGRLPGHAPNVDALLQRSDLVRQEGLAIESAMRELDGFVRA